MKKFYGEGNTFPQEFAKLIYDKICIDLKTSPLDFGTHIKQDKHMEFENYQLSEKQIKPIAYSLPFMSKLRSVKMRHCNISDKAAA